MDATPNYKRHRNRLKFSFSQSRFPQFLSLTRLVGDQNNGHLWDYTDLCVISHDFPSVQFMLGVNPLMQDDVDDEFDDSVVKIVAGRHKGRIAYADCIELTMPKHYAIIFGNPLVAPSFHFVQTRYLTHVTTPDLFERKAEIERQIRLQTPKRPMEKQVDVLLELNLILSSLYDRLMTSQYNTASDGKRVFLSHSSKDKVFVRYLATDLTNAGHRPWLDEWEIRVGESIPSRISAGIEDADAVAVVLSENALDSLWVEREWQAKYWREIVEKRVMVLPVLHRDCTIPTLLATKRYADFRSDYRLGLQHLLAALK